jgi:hypothetical protein
MKTSENWALVADDRPKFNVVILYEDGHTGKRAKHFYDNVIRQLEDECDFNLELWNFQMIAIPEIADSTAQAAAQADLVIVSLHGKVELPDEIRNWIEEWPRLIVDRDPALVALLDKPQKRRGTAASTLAYLRSVADRYGVSFFAHTTFSTATN